MHGDDDLNDKDTGTVHGVPAGAAEEGTKETGPGSDRLQSETAPLQPDAGKDI